MQLLGSLFTAHKYSISRHAEGRILHGEQSTRHGLVPKAAWKFLSKAHAHAQGHGRDVHVSSALASAAERRRTVFVDAIIQKHESRLKILELLREHVERNVVQIGKRYYRQREGIPQGSIVSSLLCSFFYAELERDVLGFTQLHKGTVLLRLIDDFLLVSTSLDVARRFVTVMHKGVPQYGLQVKREKTRTNFDVSGEGLGFAGLPQITDFPYCGYAIDTVNLNIVKDEARRRHNSKCLSYFSQSFKKSTRADRLVSQTMQPP